MNINLNVGKLRQAKLFAENVFPINTFTNIQGCDNSIMTKAIFLIVSIFILKDNFSKFGYAIIQNIPKLKYNVIKYFT